MLRMKILLKVKRFIYNILSSNYIIKVVSLYLYKYNINTYFIVNRDKYVLYQKNI